MDLMQLDETSVVDTIIIHHPNIEVFMSMLHPAASLYADVTTNSELNKNFENLKEILRAKKIRMLTVRDCLKMKKEALIELSMNCLTYVAENADEGKDNEQFRHYMSDEYKHNTLSKLDADQLVDVVLTHPTYTLRYTTINTNVEFANISFKPLGNLLYVRDQQIITQKGVVIGKFNANVREIEQKIMRQVFTNLGVKIVGEVPTGCLLEGGDFMILNPDLAVLGIGMRTNFEAAVYLMENDLIGCQRLALVIDENDMAQERMHLDTYFNILNEQCVVLLDFKPMGLGKNGKPLHRRVVVYEKNKEVLEFKKKRTSDIKMSPDVTTQTHYGNYKLREKYDDFQDFLVMENYKICWVNLEQQQDYITNFLNIGNNNVISVCRDLEKVAKKYYIDDVLIDYLDFTGVKKLYGAIHCASQVSRGCIFKVDHNV
jgi:arginine deiminase